MNDKIYEILDEQKKTNDILEKIFEQNKSENDLLTIEDVHKEYGIGLNTARKMFGDLSLPVQRYTKPFKVSRQALNEYLKKPHDYLTINGGG